MIFSKNRELKKKVFNLEVENRILNAILLDQNSEKNHSLNFGLQPFNGQEKRREAVEEILAQFKPQVILETGTYLGNTTVFLSGFAETVRTCELHPQLFKHAKKKFANHPNISVFEMDSRNFLDKEIPEIKNKRVFCYLDAHWYDDLPLAKELSQLSMIEDVVVLIDDFKVPHDLGYGFDKYKKQILDLNLIKKEIQKGQWKIFFPNCGSQEETGSRRGWCLLVKGAAGQNLSHPWLKTFTWAQE